MKSISPGKRRFALALSCASVMVLMSACGGGANESSGAATIKVTAVNGSTFSQSGNVGDRLPVKEGLQNPVHACC